MSLNYINDNYIRKERTTTVCGSINISDNTLYNLSDPVNPHDVATKEYVDTSGSAIIKTRYGSFGAIGNIVMRDYTLTNVFDPADPQDVATKQYVDEANKAFVFGKGRYMAVVDVSMGGRRINNVGTPIEHHQATN